MCNISSCCVSLWTTLRCMWHTFMWHIKFGCCTVQHYDILGHPIVHYALIYMFFSTTLCFTRISRVSLHFVSWWDTISYYSERLIIQRLVTQCIQSFNVMSYSMLCDVTLYRIAREHATPPSIVINCSTVWLFLRHLIIFHDT